MADNNIQVRLTAKDELSGPLRNAAQSISDFAGKTLNLNGVLSSLAGSLSVGLAIRKFINETV